jgi:hypothetical protein
MADAYLWYPIIVDLLLWSHLFLNLKLSSSSSSSSSSSIHKKQAFFHALADFDFISVLQVSFGQKKPSTFQNSRCANVERL